MFMSHVKLPRVSDYEVHQHLHKLFDSEQRRFLFRRMGEQDYLMLSITKPRHPAKPLTLDGIETGRPLSFAADLVIQKSSRRYKSGKEDIKDRFGRRDWLKRQLGDAASLRFVRFEDDWIRLKSGMRRLLVQTTGVIEIHDRARFATLLQFGIGRNKAFGAGLIYLPEIMPWPLN